MIKLYQFKPAWGLPNTSPFCWKVENYLRMAELPYQAKIGNPRSAPKQKLPTIDDDGTIVCDSSAIIEHLKKKHGDKLDAKLDAEQRAHAHLIRRLFEESLYWPMIYARWMEDAGFAMVRDEVLKPVLPAGLKTLVPPIVRRQLRAALHAQGTGRHTPAEIYQLAGADLAAIADVLGDRSYMLGQEPTSVDATAYAFLGAMLWLPPASALTRHIQAHPNLVAYAERMRERYWGGQAPKPSEPPKTS